MHLTALLTDLSILFLAAVAVVLALSRIGLPPIVGLLTAGVLVGPGGLGLVHDEEQVEVMAELGVALLLFTVGLEFSLEKLTRIWRYVALGGGLQVLFTVLAGVAVSLLFGREWQAGVFWGYLAALSSTAIVLRALADREETAAPHGRFIVGVLIFQDLCIVPMMLTLPMLAGEGSGLLSVGITMGKAAAVVVGVMLLARLIVPRVLHRVAATRRRELFLMSVLLIAILVAVATANMGLSLALGAFLAGVVIADTDFVHQASSDVGPFRDAFASMFFVSIGMLLDPKVLVEQPLYVLGATVALIFGKMALGTLASLIMRFPARVAVLAGIGIAQVGEFSFVLLESGQEHGLVQSNEGRVFIAASVLTMMATPLLVAASPRIATGAVILRPLERLLAVRNDDTDRADDDPERVHDHVIVAGLGLGGQLLIAALEAANTPFIAIELNPDTVIRERKAGRDVRYGDVASAEVLSHVAHAEHAKMLVLLLSDAAATVRAVAVARAAYPNLHIVVRAHRTARDEEELRKLGAEVVSEDYETALEIVERVLARTGTTGEVVRHALSAVRSARGDDGTRTMNATAVLGAVAMDAVSVTETDWCFGKTIGETSLGSETGGLVVAIERSGQVSTSPDAGTRLQNGDVLIVSGTRAQLDRAATWLRGGV